METLIGPLLVPHIQAIAKATRLPLTDTVVLIKCESPVVFHFHISIRSAVVGLELTALDNGPHPDNDGTRLTQWKAAIVGYTDLDEKDKKTLVDAVKSDNWDYMIISGACDAIAAIYLDTVLQPVKAD